MDIKHQIHNQRNRFLKLSLKKSEQQIKMNRSSDLIILDDSFDKLKSEFLNTPSQKNYSPIVINDSMDFSLDEELPKVPSISGNVSFNRSIEDSPHSQTKKPNIDGWSPAQNIICATPRYETIPSTPKDIINESLEQCSVNKIQLSQKKILDDIYGNVWQTIPKLFKSKPNDCFNGDTVIKKLQFDDEESDTESIRHHLEISRKLYLTGSDLKKDSDLNVHSERKTKKKLYTEKVPNTPEVLKQKLIRRDVNSTTKKNKVKNGLSVTELVNIMKEDKNLLVNKLGKAPETAAVTPSVENVKRLSFIGSLADNVPSWRCHPEALQYRDNFKNLREQLTRRLYAEFNREVFGSGLDADMPIVWDTKLRSTAGTTTNRLIKTANGERIRTSSVKLSTKVLDAPARVRDTLVHEMCHAATWIIDGELRAKHGPLWKNWATRALKVYPELREISRCHSMAIHFKYTYKCSKCGYSFHRHSKSIDITKKCCGCCRGKFEILVNKKTKEGVVVSTPVRKGNANEFALYVKENYGTAKGGRNHAQVMKMLGEQFSAKKRRNVEVT